MWTTKHAYLSVRFQKNKSNEASPSHPPQQEAQQQSAAASASPAPEQASTSGGAATAAAEPEEMGSDKKQSKAEVNERVERWECK